MIKSAKGEYMAASAIKKHFTTIIIGGGQAGLAAGYHLKQVTEDFVILDASSRVGDSWRYRWDSLRLFTPNKFSALPGWSYPAPEESHLNKEQMAEYLELYAMKFSLPVRSGIKVVQLSKTGDGFLVQTNGGNYTCDSVVVTTGTHQTPNVPAFADGLNPGILQMHSAAYRNASDIPYGKVLVVGAATSGIEIAIELSKSRQTMIAGKPSFVVPAAAFRLGLNFYWWLINHVLTVKTPMGRKAMPGIIKGGAVVPQMLARLNQSGITRLPKVIGEKNGLPLLEDGRTIPVSTIIWCTGYRPDFSWIKINKVIGENGWPMTKRGVAVNEPGLYFVGMPFQFGLTSGLVGGVGRDAHYVVNSILQNTMQHEKI